MFINKRGFTVLEIILFVIAVPAFILGFILINAYIPTLVLQAFDYEIGFWFYLYVSILAAAMGFCYSLLGATRSAGKDATILKRNVKSWFAYILHSILLMLIFSATGSNIGLVHLIIAGLPIPIFLQTIGFVFRRFRSKDKPEESKLIIK